EMVSGGGWRGGGAAYRGMATETRGVVAETASSLTPGWRSVTAARPLSPTTLAIGGERSPVVCRAERATRQRGRVMRRATGGFASRHRCRVRWSAVVVDATTSRG